MRAVAYAPGIKDRRRSRRFLFPHQAGLIVQDDPRGVIDEPGIRTPTGVERTAHTTGQGPILEPLGSAACGLQIRPIAHLAKLRDPIPTRCRLTRPQTGRAGAQLALAGAQVCGTCPQTRRASAQLALAGAQVRGTCPQTGRAGAQLALAGAQVCGTCPQTRRAGAQVYGTRIQVGQARAGGFSGFYHGQVLEALTPRGADLSGKRGPAQRCARNRSHTLA